MDERKQTLKVRTELAITAISKTMQTLESELGSSINLLDITSFPMTLHYLMRISGCMRSQQKVRVITDLVVDDQNTDW